MPGEGNSVPIVWDDRIFVTCPIDGGKIRSLLCFDRNSGRKLWDVKIPYPAKETTHGDNPFCSGSATTDGRLVYASFGSAGVIACDFDGCIVWHRQLGKLTHVFGQATTPVLYNDLVIVHRGPGDPTHIVALDHKTGSTVWDRPERGKNDNLFGSWSTPVIVRVGNHDELIVSLPEEIKGFDPRTGTQLWRCGGLGTEVYTMPTVGKNLVVGISGHRGPAMGVRLGGKGDVTETHRLWLTPRNQQRVGCGIVPQTDTCSSPMPPASPSASTRRPENFSGGNVSAGPCGDRCCWRVKSCTSAINRERSSCSTQHPNSV